MFFLYQKHLYIPSSLLQIAHSIVMHIRQIPKYVAHLSFSRVVSILVIIQTRKQRKQQLVFLVQVTSSRIQCLYLFLSYNNYEVIVQIYYNNHHIYLGPFSWKTLTYLTTLCFKLLRIICESNYCFWVQYHRKINKHQQIIIMELLYQLNDCLLLPYLNFFEF